MAPQYCADLKQLSSNSDLNATMYRMQRATSCYLAFHPRLVVFAFVCYLVIPFVSPLNFKITSFDKSSNDLLFEGAAVSTYRSADLTPTAIIPPQFQVGRIQYSNPIYIRDSITGRQADFSTRFSFTIVPLNSTRYSDGIALFLAPVGFTIPPNSAGGFLGLFNASTATDGSQNQIMMVEFDTHHNKGYDPPGDHIGINLNSLSSLANQSWDSRAHSGKATNVVVTYDSTSKNLSVFWSFDGEPVSLDNKNSSLTHQIDLAQVLPESVAIGFSASYGLYGARHIVNSWEFTSNLDVVRPPSTSTSVKCVNSKNSRLLTIISASLASVLLIFSAGSCLLMIKTRENHELCAETDIEKEIKALPHRFSYQELVAATSGFSQDWRLGEGGTCHVYRGFLNRSDCLVAVKRIFTESKHLEKVFINEVKIISRTVHRNLVQLIGWCREERECLLVYEYMPNGSLDNHLFGSGKILPWDVRCKIALGLAAALKYLHEDLEQCVLHRDIKAANILLDTDLNTKLGDFGVAKLIDPRFRTQTTEVVGTYGYLAPEYLNGRKATRESDMFSFGVVVLEIACGRRTYQDGEFHVPLYKWVWQLYLAGNMLEAADEKLGSSFDGKEMECLMMVGLWCVHPDPKKRPKAGQVIRYLQLEVPVPELALAAYEAPSLYEPPALRIVSSASSSSCSSPSCQGIFVSSKMDQGFQGHTTTHVGFVDGGGGQT